MNNSKPIKDAFIAFMKAIAEELCSKHKLKVTGLDVLSLDRTVEELDEHIRFDVVDPSENAGYVDISYSSKGYGISVGYCDIEEGSL